MGLLPMVTPHGFLWRGPSFSSRSAPSCPSYFSIAATKHADKAMEVKMFIVAHSAKGTSQSIMAGNSWYRELEAAGHSVPTVRKQPERQMGVLGLLSPFFSEPPACGTVPPTPQAVSLI